MSKAPRDGITPGSERDPGPPPWAAVYDGDETVVGDPDEDDVTDEFPNAPEACDWRNCPHPPIGRVVTHVYGAEFYCSRHVYPAATPEKGQNPVLAIDIAGD